MSIQHVGVVGAGTMGGGIAQVCIAHGLDVMVVEADAGRLEAGVERIRGRLAREVERERMTQADCDAALARLHGTTDLGELAGADLVVEAIVEELEPKQALFRDLDRICRPDAVLASNTSSLSLSAIAGAVARPERVVGLHFFNPPTALRLVEVVTSAVTSAEAVETALAFCEQTERVTVRTQDAPGFIVNRLLIPFLFDAVRLVEAGNATAEDVDAACRTGLGHTMGPLATCDLIGLDVLAEIGESMFEEFGEPRFKAPGLLRRLVSLGMLGRKSGHGFFTYEQ